MSERRETIERLARAARRHCQALRAMPYDEQAAVEACEQVESALVAYEEAMLDDGAPL
jgi:hypothetical protein